MLNKATQSEKISWTGLTPPEPSEEVQATLETCLDCSLDPVLYPDWPQIDSGVPQTASTTSRGCSMMQGE